MNRLDGVGVWANGRESEIPCWKNWKAFRWEGVSRVVRVSYLRQYSPNKKQVRWRDSTENCPRSNEPNFFTSKSASATLCQYGQCVNFSVYVTEYFQWLKLPWSSVILKFKLCAKKRFSVNFSLNIVFTHIVGFSSRILLKSATNSQTSSGLVFLIVTSFS